MKEKTKIVNSDEIEVMPCVALRDLVIYPNMIIHFDVARPASLLALKKALENDGKVFLVAQKDANIKSPTYKDMYKVGVVAEVKQMVKNAEGLSRVLVEGISKAKAHSVYLSRDKHLEAEVKLMPTYSNTKANKSEIQALCREVKKQFEQYASFNNRMPKDLYTQVVTGLDAEKLYEALAFNLSFELGDKQGLLEKGSIDAKLKLLLEILYKECSILSVENKIQQEVMSQIELNQKEYFLREQMKAIQEELGEDSSDDINEKYIKKIKALKLEDVYTDKLIKEAKRLEHMPSSSQEAAVIVNYLDTVLALPWNTKTKDKIDIKKARMALDKDHYGLKKVKERILENLSVRALSPEVKGQIICLYGPPGVGKTSIGKSIANAMGRKYVRVSLGGVRDEAEIRGHRKTYVGAMPGRIINAIKQAGAKNPIILLDEIDKMSNDFKGDPSSAMLEVLDSEQNVAFRDHYLEIPFDLSDVLFITTANVIDTIQPPLLDRMEVIELSSYTREEKFNIAKKHLIPKQIKQNGLKASQIKITDSCIYTLIDSYTKEAGVRKLERFIASLCRKAAKEIIDNGLTKVTYKDNNIEKYLGTKKYLPDLVAKKNEIGLVNGLAWTSVGGVTMPLEALVLDGKGEVVLTGSLGDVMKESAKIAVSYCRSVADKYGIEKDFYKTKDLHIHAPEGAVPKDGPSAGVTMVTAMISALSGIPVNSSIAMTGEITLRGNVLPIGGLREKSMGAYKAGIKTIIIPSDNKADIDEIDDVVKTCVDIIPVKTIDEVLDLALVKPKDKLDIPYCRSIKKKAKESILI